MLKIYLNCKKLFNCKAEIYFKNNKNQFFFNEREIGIFKNPVTNKVN